MAIPRRLQTLTVPTGPAVESILPTLAAAIAGETSPLLPLSARDPRSAEIAAGLHSGEPLSAEEDDESDPTAFVIATSGSTGSPKGTLLTAAALTASAAATHARLGGTGRWLLALPAQHIAGLQVLLRSVVSGTIPAVVDTAAPFTPEAFTAATLAMDEAPATRRYVSLVPTQLHRILADRDATAAAGTFDAVLIGGAAAAPGLLSRARASGIPVVTTYGMSETCGGCVYDGRPLPGVTARIEDDGRILLTGPVVARGYRGRPGDPAFPAPGAFRTEDRGVLDAEGLLTVHGRVDDVIVSGGTKVAPSALEDRLSALPGIGQAVVVGVPDAEWGQATAALVTADGTAPDLGSVRDALADLPAAWRPRHLIVVPEIPLLGIGKPDRTAAAALAAAHVLGREASSGNVQGQIEADDARPSARP